MTLRNMTFDDYEKVYALWLDTPDMGLNNLDDTKEGITKYLSRNPNTCFVAEEDGNITGVILCGHDGRRGFIYHTAVEKSKRRRGLGTALVNAALDALKREGINRAALVVYENNENGNAFWEKRGFTTRSDLTYRNKAIKEFVRIVT